MACHSAVLDWKRRKQAAILWNFLASSLFVALSAKNQSEYGHFHGRAVGVEMADLSHWTK